MALRLILCVLLMAPTLARAQEGPMDFFIAFTRTQLATQGFERLEADGMVWWQKGTGPTLVMIHGVADQAGTWFQVAPALAESRRVLLVDLPGHGDSPPADGPLKMTTVVQGFTSWLEAHAEGPAILVGNSMGAWVASVVAHRRPDLVARVVAVNGGPLKADTGELNLVPKDRDEARRLMAALRDPKSPPTPDAVLDDLVRRAENGHVQRMLAETQDLESHLLDGRLQELTTPVDILWGESDRYMGRDYPDRLAAALPNARLTLIPACGHLPQAECAPAFLQALQDALTATAPGKETPAGCEHAADEPCEDCAHHEHSGTEHACDHDSGGDGSSLGDSSVGGRGGEEDGGREHAG